jgi:hypothetical protein
MVGDFVLKRAIRRSRISVAPDHAVLDQHPLEERALAPKAATAPRIRRRTFSSPGVGEGADFYYLGQAISHASQQTTMPGADGAPLDVVRMPLRLAEPIDSPLLDYFHPTITGKKANATNQPK